LQKHFKHHASWRRNQDGSVAIEFALVAIPFVLIVIGIIELSLMFAANALLQGAVQDAGRLIRTGQVQQSDDPETMFQTALCNHAGILLNCNQLQYHVTTIASFADADMNPALDEEGNLSESEFFPGGARDIVLIRTIYLYPIMTPLIGQFLSDFSGNRKLLVSTVALETEPYETSQQE